MKIVIRFISTILLFSGCNQIAYVIPEKDLIPEGITYSYTTNSFYISSIKKTKIIQVNAGNGTCNDYISSELLGLSFLGMIVDDSNGHLWACGNKVENNVQYSAVTKFNLKSGELIKSYLHTDTSSFLFNDLTQDKNGNVYITNSRRNEIYRIDFETDSISLFFESDQIEHPNGITISPDNKYLYIASTDKGIRVLDIEKLVILGEFDSTINSTGIDGLKYYKNSLIGIQNAVEEESQIKIARYFLDESGTKIIKMEIIDQNNPLFDIPTTLVVVDNHIYCLANSQLKNLKNPSNEIIDPMALKNILLLKYKL
ncbi:MAG: SMP-30/gluconolactonase/LRE family protein [Bacteroidales bacterium]|jgi:DNA-binding beta-propeller fold protein YncE|nr:SMP-30/gluconolactonase/LRE family protein [Bacteroidales bacterium]